MPPYKPQNLTDELNNNYFRPNNIKNNAIKNA